MNNMEKLKSLTREELARINVRPFMYMSGYSARTSYITSDCMICDTKEEAEEHELEWLGAEEDNNVFGVK